MSCRKIVPTAVLALSLAMALGFGQTAVAGATVKTASPELSGNGLLATPITFNGISHEPTTFGGNGLTATPLTLLVVDGGTWT